MAYTKPKRRTARQNLKRRVTFTDPITGEQTDIYAFAEKANVHWHVVYSYWRNHGQTLDGWETRRTKTNKPYTLNGEHVSLSTLAEKAGMALCSIAQKMRKQGVTEYNDIDFTRKSRAQSTTAKRISHNGKELTLTEWAQHYGVVPNTITNWLRRHNGSLDGFENRQTIQLKPPTYYHKKLNISKTKREWAEHFGVSKQCIVGWLRLHGTIDGFENRIAKRHGQNIQIRYNGQTHSIDEWSEIYKCARETVRQYYSTHKHSLRGFDKWREKCAQSAVSGLAFRKLRVDRILRGAITKQGVVRNCTTTLYERIAQCACNKYPLEEILPAGYTVESVKHLSDELEQMKSNTPNG